MHAIISLILAFTLAAFAAPMAQTGETVEAGRLKEIGDLLDKAAAADTFSAAVLIARGGKPVFQKAYGMANQEKHVANRTDTKFNFGSMNKMFTSVAIAQLAERGKLSFDDPIVKHLPDYPNPEVAAKVTIHQLLTHAAHQRDRGDRDEGLK